MARINDYLGKGLTKLIRVYRFLISPWFVNSCRFYPSCSHYAETALIRFGFFRGTGLMIRRLLKCHPWHPGGVDFVPEKETKLKLEPC